MGLAAARVDVAAHLGRLKIRRLFIHKSDKAKRGRRCLSGETSRQGEERGHPASVIVRPGTTNNRIIMRADHHNLRARALDFRLDVVTVATAKLIGNTL